MRKLTSAALATLLLLFSNLAFGQSQDLDLNREIQHLQKKFGQGYTPYPIVIFNQDEIAYRFAQQKAFGEGAKDKRLEIIQEYVNEKTGVELTKSEADQYEPYVTVLKNSALALPTLRGDWGNKEYAVCAVFHSSANSNQYLEMERVLGMKGAKREEVYGDLTFDQYTQPLSYKKLALFSLYHELSHCLDQNYMPETYGGHTNSHDVHRSESFAETMAFFLLRREGFRDLAKKRSSIRATYSLRRGRFFPKYPSYGIGNPHYAKGGAIYYLSPVLLAALDKVTFDLRDIETKSVSELKKISTEIVQEKSLASRSFFAVASYLKAKNPQDAIDDFKDRAYQDPEYFHESYLQLMNFVNHTDLIDERIFDPNRKAPRRNERLLPINYSGLCSVFVEGDQQSLNQEILKLRLDLRKTQAPITRQKERAKELKRLFQKLSEQC